MNKRQKQTLMVMALVMVLIVGAAAVSVFNNSVSQSRESFQSQVDAQVTAASR